MVTEKGEKWLKAVKELIESKTKEELLQELHNCSDGVGPTLEEFQKSLKEDIKKIKKYRMKKDLR